ncbi:MAG: glycosyltransferase family 4 protein, partial [Candidatus Acidiferrales bacterium]
MKVFFPIITNFSGADIYFERLAAGLADQGWQPDLRRYPHIMEFLPYTALKPFLRPNRECTLVHTKAEYGWLFAVPQRPLVVTLAHSVFDPAYAGSKGLGKRLYHNLKLKGNIARSFARADRIVTVSHFSARSIAECFGRDDIRVIHNGVDESLFRPPTDNALRRDPPHRLLFVGNCTARKGFDLLPRILDRLGEGFLLEYTSGLRTRTSRPPHPAMRCLGQLRGAELVQAYQRSDIFLFPSRLEGFGYPVA